MRSLCLTVLFVFLAGSVFGQTTSITGTVTDPSGSVVPNAAIALANAETGIQREQLAVEHLPYGIG